MERLHRRLLVAAPYNPRTITPEARKKLKANLQSVGLLAPVTWNRTTGTILGGHQRLSVLDALEGKDDYLLDVAVVELSEIQEREQNIALNNTQIQGDWQMDLLADLLKTPELNLDATGFTLVDIQIGFDDAELSTLFAPNEPTAELLLDVQKMQDDGKPAAGARPKRATDEIRARGEIMKVTRSENSDNFATDDMETIAVLVFRTRAERDVFAQRFGADPGTAEARYLDGAAVASALIQPDAATQPPRGAPGSVSADSDGAKNRKRASVAPSGAAGQDRSADSPGRKPPKPEAMPAKPKKPKKPAQSAENGASK